MEKKYTIDTSSFPSIKWVKNSRVSRNPKIQPWQILKEESDAEAGDAVVTMLNSSKKNPIINIKFPSETEINSREEKSRNGQWITKSWTVKNSLTVTINTEEDHIHFNKTRYTRAELDRIMEVIDYVSEIN